MIYYNDYVFSKKIVYRLIKKLEYDGMTQTTHTELEILGFRKLFEQSINKIVPYFPQYGAGFAEINIVHTLAIMVIIEILKRSLSTNFIDSNFRVDYTAINHRIQVIWS